MLKRIYILIVFLLIALSSWSQVYISWPPSRNDCVNSTNTFYLIGATATSWTITGNYKNLVISPDKSTITFTWNGPYSGAIIKANYTGGGCPTTTCTASTSSFNVSNVVTPVVNLNSTAVAVEYGTPVTFTAVPTNGGTGPTYQWYLNSVAVSGQTSVQYTNPVLQNGDKIVVNMQSKAACATPVSDDSDPFTITVSYKITPPTVTQVSIPLNTSTTLIPRGASTNETFRWYTVASGGSYFLQGFNYTTPALTTHTTYYISKYNTSTGAESARVALTVTLTVAAPEVPVLSTNTCGEKVLTKGTPPSNIQWYWQGTNSAGTSLNNAATYTIKEANDQTYYLRAKSTTGDIWSDPVGVKVTTDPVDIAVTNYQSKNS